MRDAAEPVPRKELLVAVVFKDFAHLSDSNFILILNSARRVDLMSALASLFVEIGCGEINSHRHVHIPSFLQILDEVGLLHLFEYIEH